MRANLTCNLISVSQYITAKDDVWKLHFFGHEFYTYYGQDLNHCFYLVKKNEEKLGGLLSPNPYFDNQTPLSSSHFLSILGKKIISRTRRHILSPHHCRHHIVQKKVFLRGKWLSNFHTILPGFWTKLGYRERGDSWKSC